MPTPIRHSSVRTEVFHRDRGSPVLALLFERHLVFRGQIVILFAVVADIHMHDLEILF